MGRGDDAAHERDSKERAFGGADGPRGGREEGRPRCGEKDGVVCKEAWYGVLRGGG